jgi:hypothetical protein
MDHRVAALARRPGDDGGGVIAVACRSSITRQRTGTSSMRLQLSLATAANPRSWPILDGTVKPDGIDLIPTAIHPS